MPLTRSPCNYLCSISLSSRLPHYSMQSSRPANRSAAGPDSTKPSTDHFLAYRYHCPKVLATMNRYRIGRVSGPWVNFTPPIRGGRFSHSTSEDPPSKSKSSSIHTNASSESSHVQEPMSELRPLSNLPLTSLGSLPADGAEASPMPTKEPDNASVVKQALEDDMDNYPSLDAETQQNIVQKYRDLHAVVKVGGYYDCRYREYAKELARYLCIFSSFFIALRAGWYTTSAALLGLFWVWHMTPSPSQETMKLTLSSIKSCLLLTMQGTRGLLTTSLSTP